MNDGHRHRGGSIGKQIAREARRQLRGFPAREVRRQLGGFGSELMAQIFGRPKKGYVRGKK